MNTISNLYENNSGLFCLLYEHTESVLCNDSTYEYRKEKEKLTASNGIFWIYICIYIFLIVVCGIMQGLVLAVVSLDLTDLKVISQAGTERTRKYAKRLIPLVQRHHLVLVTLVVANATAATAMPIFFERLTNPITAIVVSATAFLIFGDLVWTLMALFFIIAYPVSLLLDWMLGKDSGTLRNRKELSALVDVHGPIVATTSNTIISCGRQHVDVPIERLSADEVLVIKGALAMGQKIAKQVMVKLEDVYMLPADAVLDEALVQEIFNVGHSRIPVYEGNRMNVIGVFLTKRLIMIDPKQALSIGTIFHSPDSVRALYPPFLVDEITPLYDLLNQFQTGTCTHMAFITKTTTVLTKKIVGIVTMEDLIEELLQEEIRDESDLLRQWRLQVAKVKVVHRLTKGIQSNQPIEHHPIARFLSVPSSLNTIGEEESTNLERKNSMSYIS